jgi:hypothetical protein
MATVQTHWYTKGGKNLVEQEVGWVPSPVTVALMKGGWVIDQDGPEAFTDIAADEATGTGYSAGGVVIAGRAVTLDPATNETRLLGNPVEWPNSTILARGAAIYVNTGVKPLLGYVDFESDRQSDQGLFRIEWPATGVLRTRAL